MRRHMEKTIARVRVAYVAWPAVAIAAFIAIAAPMSHDPARANDAAPKPNRVVGAMIEGARHSGPPAHRAFCKRRPSECAPSAAPRPGAYGALSEDGLRRLAKFNAQANAAFRPIVDKDYHGVSDYWTLPVTAADCEDYVLYKRAQLIKAGWPPESALIAVVKSPTVGHHAVLVLRTEAGELVLDNMRNEILDWRDTGYKWVIRQSTQDPSVWVEILEPASKSGA